MKGKNTKIITYILIFIILACVVYIGKTLLDKKESANEINQIYNIIELSKANKNDEFNQDSYMALAKENGDLKGYIEFDSKIISQPIVQARDNDYYLRRSFYGKYSDEGTPFMDAYCSLDSTNITVYGHTSYIDNKAMFSQLNNMTTQKFFDENNKFKVYMYRNIHHYQVAYVYRISEEEFQEYDFAKAEFASEEEFNDFISFAKRKNLVNSGIDIEYGNKIFTLQTCKLWNENERIIVVGKEILVKDY